MSKKPGVIALVVIVIALVVWGIVANMKKQPAQTAAGQPIKIGVVAPLTGGATAYGTGLVDGAELAFKQLSPTKNKYVLVVEDDATKPAQSASAAEKLISVDKVQALISVTSGTGNAVKNIASAANIPHICVCADTRIADATDFTNSVMPDEESLAWLREAAAQGAKKVALISQNQPGFNLIVDQLLKQASSTGITVISNEKAEPTVQDFNTIISKSKLLKPDLFMIGFFPPQLDIIGQQLQNLKVANISGIATFTTGAKPELYNDKWYTDASLADPSFKADFQREYPQQRFNVRVAPQGYDSVNILVKAFESGIPVADFIRNLTSYDGKAGVLAKKQGESVFHSPIGIWKIENGQPVQIK